MRLPLLRHERLLRAARVFLVSGALVGSSVAVEACTLEDEPGVDPADPGALPPDDEGTRGHDAGPGGEAAGEDASAEPTPRRRSRLRPPRTSGGCSLRSPTTVRRSRRTRSARSPWQILDSKARYAREGTRTYVSASSPKFVWVAAALHAGQTVARVEPLALPIFARRTTVLQVGWSCSSARTRRAPSTRGPPA